MTSDQAITFPSGWGHDRLKDISQINAESLPASCDPELVFPYLDISNVDYFGIVDRDQIERLRFEDAPSRARRRVAKHCTIVSSVRPNLQANAYFADDPKDLICSTGFNVVQPNEDHLEPRFLHYVLKSPYARQYFEAVATGVGYPAVADKDFGALEVPLPLKDEQVKIADYLDASCAGLDTAVRAKQEQLATLASLRESIVEGTVMTGVSKQPALRTVNLDWIQRIPEHWSVVRVKRLLSSADYGISETTERLGRFAVLKMGNLQDGECDMNGLEYVDEVPDSLVLETGDLLYNRTNSPDQVGKAAVFRGEYSDAITFASYLVRLRTNHRANPYYLNYVLNSRGFLSFARKLAIPSVQQSNLNATRYGRLHVPLPDLAEQTAICEYLDERLGLVARVTDVIAEQVHTLEAYRSSLIFAFVTGARRIGEGAKLPATALSYA